MIFGMLLTTLIIQASNNSITPIISLYVRELMHGNGNVTFTSGIIAAIPGIATMAAAPKLGALGDRIGTERILTIGFIMAICFSSRPPLSLMSGNWEFCDS